MSEERFLTRVTGMSVAFGVCGAWFLLALGRPWHAISFAIGTCLSVGMFASAAFLVRRGLAPGMPRLKWVAGVVAIAKYVVAAFVIWRFVEWRHSQAGAFILGVAVTQIVLVLKAIGRTMAPDKEPFRWDRALANLTRMKNPPPAH